MFSMFDWVNISNVKYIKPRIIIIMLLKSQEMYEGQTFYYRHHVNDE